MALIEGNLHAFWDLYGAMGAEPIDGVPAMAYLGDHPFGLLNPVTRFRCPDGDVEAAIAKLLAAAERRGHDQWWWGGPSDQPADLGQRLAAGGLAAHDPSPGMELALDGWRPSERPDGLEVVPVGAAEWDEYLAVFFAAFGFPDELHDPLGRVLADLGEDGRIGNFLGRDGDQAVGCATLLLADDVAGIWNVGTVERARGRGTGTALTAAAMAAGAERGAHHAVLIATPMGEPVYESMGFATTCEMPLWSRLS